jgi:uncharacterized protein (DUF952 family)
MILHISDAQELSQALATGEIRTPSLDTQGFVHCSDFGTMHLPANRIYAGRTGLKLLVVDPALVPAPVRWEAADPPQPGGPLFPHVYGPIPMTAVVGTHDLPPAADGTFGLPTALADSKAT